MRPEILNPLFAPIRSLPGVGTKLGQLLEEIAGAYLINLCWQLPYSLIDRSFSPAITALDAGMRVCLQVEVVRHIPPPPIRRRIPYRVLCRDSTGDLTLTFFHAHANWLAKMLPAGEERIVCGQVEMYGKKPQLIHPDIMNEEEFSALPRMEPVYRQHAGISSRVLGKLTRAALERLPDLPEWHRQEDLTRESWPSWKEAMIQVHHPEGADGLKPESPARRRLAADEFLASHLALALMRQALRSLPGRVFPPSKQLREKVLAALPFSLTASQMEAVETINADMAREGRMLRLLQGDVGSGKTIVAFMALLNAIETGAQTAFMAPTEILVRQHAARLSPLCVQAGITMMALTGSEKKPARERVLRALADGSCQLLVGTHSLFQKDVQFKDLGFIVIDEQQRFGVAQRTDLARKGRKPDMLIMTATPIPRTLLLTHFGDANVSRILGKPPGRKPVQTRMVSLSRLDEVMNAVSRVAARGERVYWVCPLVEGVEEGSKAGLADVLTRCQSLEQRPGLEVRLVHGRLDGAKREAALNDFREGRANVLVATTVIEVGVDVPEASIMVIEHAERFGLAQLHQLRGRIGRGETESTCLLLYQPPLGETAKRRLEVMRATEDGFKIADEDMQLRGGGEILGEKQSGLPSFRVADPAHHRDLISFTAERVEALLTEDPHLKSERGQFLRTLLYLFERDEAAPYLRSG